MLINFTQPKVQASTMTDLATHCETVHVHWCIHAASSCLQILLIPYCWSVALEKKKKKKEDKERSSRVEGGDYSIVNLSNT